MTAGRPGPAIGARRAAAAGVSQAGAADERPARARSRARRPTASPSSLARPTLERELAEGSLQRRLTLVIAGAGFGKTTLLSRLAERGRAAWYTVDTPDRDPAVLAAGVADALRDALPGFETDVGELARGPAPAGDDDAVERGTAIAHRLVDAIDAALSRPTTPATAAPLLVVLDDVHQLGDAAAAWAFVETVVRVAPLELHFVIGSRTEPRFAIERMRGRGEVAELGGPSLAFSRDEIATVVSRALAAHRPPAAELAVIADQVAEATAGWPAAVRLAAEALRAAAPADRPGTLARLRSPHGPLFAYLAEEVIAGASDRVRDLLRRTAPFDRVSAGLCEAIGVVDVERTLTGLARRALFLQPISGQEDWFELHGLVREYVLHHLPLTGDELAAVHRRAAAWFVAAAMPEAALRSLVRANDAPALAAFLLANGAALVAAGEGRQVIEAIDTVPVTDRDHGLELLLGEAGVATGDWATAVPALRRAGGDGERLSAAVAWRLGLIDGLRGAYDEALSVYRRADAAGASAEDEAFLHAFTASAHRHQGDAGATAAAASLALAAALRSGLARPRAAAYVAVGQGHQLADQLPAALDAYERALAAAEEAGDAVQRVRIHTAIGTLCLDLGRLEQANSSLDEAVTLGGAIGFPSFQARALAERGRARLWVGRVEEALADIAAGKAIYERLDSPGRLFALLDEGELHIYRGDRSAARMLLESAVAAARQSSDQLLAVCLAELAEVVAEDDPERAAALLAEAEEIDRQAPHLQTKTTIAFAHLALGNTARAGVLAVEVEASAARSGYLPQVAHAREIRAHAATDPAAARRLVDSALDIWTQLGASVSIARNRLQFALISTGPEARAAAEAARSSLQGFGAKALAAEAARRIAELDEAARPEVSIRTLGGFAVVRAGGPVTVGEWRSKKARDLLKILAGRRGRPVPREQLFELLWPDDDPEPLANRLSVALATVRSVLDPSRRHASDHYVGADRLSVWLELDRIELDVATLLSDVAAGRRLRRSGREADAMAAFERAEAGYLGDFLEEDPYEEFAAGPREEVRAAYIEAAREVAHHAIKQGDPDTATRIQLRILEIDPFDERAHTGLIRALIAAGRHGEARRRYGVYVARMNELGMDAGSFATMAAATAAAAAPRASD